VFARDLKLTMLDPGYRFNVTENRVAPLLPPKHMASALALGFVAEIDTHATHPRHTINTLLSAPHQFGDLAHAFRRSFHWRDMATSAGDDSQSILLSWMAIECLCKTNVEDDVCSKLLAVLGFPAGAQLESVSIEARRALTSLPDYRTWKNQLRAIADGLRTTRNNIVHAGFRHVELSDVLNDSQLELGKMVLALGSKRLLDMALNALNGPERSVEQMWSAYPSCLAEDLVAVAESTLKMVRGESARVTLADLYGVAALGRRRS
jgi:hypothetical protein